MNWDSSKGCALSSQGEVVEQLRTFFEESGGQGVHIVDPPSKEVLFQHSCHPSLDLEVTDRAMASRAVNIVWRRSDNRLVGDNTDGEGLVWDVCSNLGVPLAAKSILVLGVGSESRSALLSLASQRPASLHLGYRPEEGAQAQEIVSTLARFTECPLQAISLADDPAALPSYDIIIRVSRSGEDEEASPSLVPLSVLRQAQMVYDATGETHDSGHALGTPLLQAARQSGVQCVSGGLGMHIEQAAESFLVWRGIRPDTSTLLEDHQEEDQHILR